MMIDWVTAALPLSHETPIGNGKFISITSDGEIEFEKSKFLQVKGSYSSKIGIVSIHTGPDGEVRFSGNPVKFLQGHNLFGISDLTALMFETVTRIYAMLGVKPTLENLNALKAGSYSVSRVDITAMQELRNRADVLAWIRAAAHASRSRHKSGGILRGDTLYWGMNSRRWAMKVYSKGQEIGVPGHELPADILHRENLLEWADNKLRIELVLRSSELQELDLRLARNFDKVDTESIFRSYLERINMPETMNLQPDAFESLPRMLRSTYSLWKHGEDMRDMLSKNTYYKHRRMLLEYGIDISIRQPKEVSNVIPLVRVLEAVPAKIPAFAIGTSLYWDGKVR